MKKILVLILIALALGVVVKNKQGMKQYSNPFMQVTPAPTTMMSGDDVDDLNTSFEQISTEDATLDTNLSF
jgi:hypothetical protein